MNKASLAIFGGILFLVVGVAVAIFYSHGYTFNIETKNVTPTGILVATSDPDGAELYINGKLKTATNNTINLAPGKYHIKINKDGFTPWEKEVEIKKEEVYKTNAFLFPRVPDLRPLTLTGAISPSISPDYTKIAYSVASASGEKNGVYVLDMGKAFIPAPIRTGGDLKLIYRTPLLGVNFLWSPDDRQILASSSAVTNSVYLIDTDRINESLATPPLGTKALLDGWAEVEKQTLDRQLAALPGQIGAIIASSGANIKFSPDETKVMFTATSSATLPTTLTSYLPGTNPTPEMRDIKPGGFYVYDSKEDKNYLIKGHLGSIMWFPSSRHLLEYTDKQISIMEYDGTNGSVVYSGPFSKGFVVAWPNWSKIVILTSLGGGSDVGENLYTINLR